jgi:hypothetical protein
MVLLFFIVGLLIGSGSPGSITSDKIVTVKKTVKIRPFRTAQIITYRKDSCTFYFEAAQFMTTGINESKNKYHEPVLAELAGLVHKKDTVDISAHKQRAVVESLVNDALERGYVHIFFSGKEYSGRSYTNLEYWDKDVLTSKHKGNSFYRPESDIFMLKDGNIFFYFKPSVKRTEHRFRD